jgi:Protein of unknown function (DUF3551)
MRTKGLVTIAVAAGVLLGTMADAAAGQWCATYGRKGTSENCSYATLEQCRAQVQGLGGFCRPNPYPGTSFGAGVTWSGSSRR